MINRGPVPSPRPLPRPWHAGNPPKQGEYLALDRVYRGISVSLWTPELGWCIRGRWLGNDAAECWADLPEPPPHG